MNLSQKVALIKSAKLTAEKNVFEFGKKIQKLNKELNIFLVLNEKAIEQAKEIDKRIKEGKQVGKLAGLCVAVKSNISVKGLETNCASKVLESYVSAYDASVIEKLKNEDAIIIGMANMDEFACGGSGETSAFGPCKNPVDIKLIPGGSSSGSAAAVSADLCDFALGSDTGGSIRNPASHCNVVGLKPSYGAISRYGLLDLSMSLDQIGIITKSVEDIELVFNVIRGQDNFDCVSKNLQVFQNKKQLTIGLVNVQDFCDKEIVDLIKEKTEQVAKKNGWKIKEIHLPLDIAIEAYYVLVYTEFFSTTRKFDGRRFGKKIEGFCGPEVLRRILGGSEISKAEYHGRYYRDSLKAKAFVKKQFESLFEQVDLIVLPTVPKTAHKIGEKISVKEMYAYDVFTIPANLAGICGISIPCGKIDGKPLGIQIFASALQDDFLLEKAREFE
jgi:aspartyl-tRNA(Asn)/glutamyl-tRNA(Gln) amidotransferase subunit A